jgi:hypothetical protein
MTPTHQHDHATATRLLVRVLQDVVRRETFSNYGDLAEAFKARCARLRIPYDAGLISDALDRLECGGEKPLVALPTRRRLVERPVEPAPDLPPADAAALVAALKVAVRGIPPIERPDHEQRLRQQVADELRAAYQAEPRHRSPDRYPYSCR